MVFLPLYIGLFAIIILTVIGIVSLITKNPNIQAFITLSIPIIMFIILPIVFSSLDSSLRGVAVTCKIPKHFKGKTFLYENAPTNRKLILKDRTGMEKVNIEDVNFNKMYTVLSTDQVEARYLLTTTFIERFQNIKTAFNAKYIRAEFKNGELILFIGVNKDMFAMGNIAKQTTYKTFFELFEEIYSILSLIEHLKLNQNIGL